MTAEGTPTASKQEAKQARRPSVYTIGIAHYTYCAPLHKFRVPCGAYFGGKNENKITGGNNYILFDLHNEEIQQQEAGQRNAD